ncbi:hypothetical protein BDV33DRAFT_182559 [Aspergillus novoparasiticus]|uniref:Uncharacterized protein n=1 Tax=Aspergillus novoparasiticus TaxID=986946 RepID=A0A5N6EB92_9EURO|nr:hypothetical protein BDV33DRAFT_182559 [Aspergillus novoparasiticus]
MTVISLVRSNKRGKTSRKRSLWVPIIAPKGTTSSSGVNPAVPVKTSIPRSHGRFPPRSRTGCWTCRSRKGEMILGYYFNKKRPMNVVVTQRTYSQM